MDKLTRRRGEPTLSNLGLLAGVIGVVIASYAVAQLMVRDLDSTVDVAALPLIEGATMVILSTLGLWFGIFRPLRTQQHNHLFQMQLQNALQMAPTETAVYDVVDRAVDAAGVRHRVQLLIADSAESQLKAVVDHHEEDCLEGCDIAIPFDCPAIRSSQTSYFASDRALDACPWLARRPGNKAPGKGAGALCVPMNAVGQAIGVLTVTVPEDQLPTGDTVVRLEALAEGASTRIRLLRVMEQTHEQASTDPLTGMLNRRSVELSITELIRSHKPFALAMADLDHFKALNDTHGHEAGDQALRSFARSAREILRSDDIVARFGGEEFVFVFPGLSSEEAAEVLERVREALALTATTGNTPFFTASFGVTESTAAASMEELLRLADAALFQAKRQGRNRIVI